MPKSKFTLLFNYSDESEDIDDKLEWEDREDIDESEWLYATSHNPAFDFLDNPEEDIYTLASDK